ncbi:tail assembly protein [Stenotrophomonas maltophilia]|jgi:predicted phage tail protein|uniref:tail assembly protein n=1 Tax=Stenotrophomonas TaxID=40323 RepID=UPI0005A43372|nr:MULTISPECIES: tail assembly protein [unclassified Stenotrophomonas]KKF89968.1 phage tail assembly protein [Stenotrophomonas maltophilia]KOQ65009.1 phage tail assembly protein [Stenotrophomonas maltophilia]MBA0254639.1 tail assembly protein [Stenotrophomonas maltophilia]MBA0379444.1 tail assembly protein [Stenotrophomonas maltophilia]MBA0407978.1 tail assembly protein [Stenotrophomonas maltophilia]
MTDRLRTIRLYGKLGARFGRRFRLAVNSPAEAVHALCTMLPGFQQYLMGAKAKGMEFAVFNGRQNLSRDQLHDPPGQDDIRIAPVLVGSKRGGVLQTIVGVVLIVVGAVASAWGYGAIGQPMMKLGVSMVIGGITQMLSPQPKGLGAKDTPENAPSYSMNGTVNTQAQGNPVPVAYGGHDTKGMFIGSAVISGGILAEDQF